MKESPRGEGRNWKGKKRQLAFADTLQKKTVVVLGNKKIRENLETGN